MHNRAVLIHLRQRAPPDAVRRQGPGQGPQNDLFAAIARAGARAAKRSLCRYLMVKTTAAHFSLRQQKITLANRPSPGQPITTSPGSV